MIVRHECDDFRGARDVWLGQVAGGREEGDRFLAEQLLVRGVLWVLHEKQALSADELRARVWPVLSAGRCGPVVHEVFPLDRTADAHRLMESSAHIGKIMLRVAEG